jgi:exodeoxyribonuclease VII large subunit
MSKPTKSQWDFGELFPVEATRKVLTVAELTAHVRRLLEKNVGQVWVTGEVTNFRAQSSGHFYFTLKDAESQLSCVLFRNEALESRALIQDGRKLVVQGDLTVYEPRGQYQLRVTAVELQGVGALQVAFEKLKQKLNGEGLFAAERKRPLPRYPQRIGIVTSPTGAAIRDVLHVVRRRNPGLEIVLVSCRVQGQGAGDEIAAAIRLLNAFNKKQTSNIERRTSNAERKTNPLSPVGREGEESRAVASSLSSIFHPPSSLDLILVTRGGGSLEDLWAFNEEAVARAIFESDLPVVSAVGHEIDFTISDFVADLRAATPSAAAEIITEGVYSSCQFLSEAATRMGQLVRQRLVDRQYELVQTQQRLLREHPRRRFDEWLQRLDDLQTSLSRCARQGTRTQREAWRNLVERLARLRPRQVLQQRRDGLLQTERRLNELMRRHVDLKTNRFVALEKHLRLLGPEQVLARGYSITTLAQTDKVVRSSDEVKAGDKLRTRLKSGEVRSVVEKTSDKRADS